VSAETILIADDEATIRAYIRNILRTQGFALIEAVDGLDALTKVQHHGEPIDLLLTDVRMPRMDGIALAHSVVQAYPRVPVVYMSGYPFDFEGAAAGERPCASLSKPFTRKALLDVLERCLHPDTAPGSSA
jgi:CheY-like chemotaxis protein